MRPFDTAALMALAAILVAPTGAFALSPSDAWITTKAKTAVVADLGATGTTVNVDTVDGVVTLHGTVATEAERKQAEEAAQNLEGVREVQNLLQVVTAEEAEAVAESDARIRDEIGRALAGERDLKDSEIEIASVHRGTVLLSGKADSSSDHDRALEIVREIPGVVEVHTEMRGPSPSEQARQQGESVMEGAENLAGSIRETASDAWVATAVKTKLLAENQTPGLDIDVEAEEGVVTLKGLVPSAEAKAAAEAEAETVEGVKRVENELEISELEDETEEAE